MPDLYINQLATLANVTVRTLQHYDKIGLLKPVKKLENGYRVYDDKSVKKLQEIIFLKEMEFNLKEIKEIIFSSEYLNNKKYIFKRHREILVLKKERLENIISNLDKIMEEKEMENKKVFDDFGMEKIEEHKRKYEKEVETKWGDSDAYKESMKKTKNYTKEDWDKIKKQSEDAYNKFIEAMNKGVDCKEANEAVKLWIKSISDNFYKLTPEIAIGLAHMYIDDERFTKNIDKIKDGLAKFMSEAILYYYENN